jgi:hypothetical protein
MCRLLEAEAFITVSRNVLGRAAAALREMRAS